MKTKSKSTIVFLAVLSILIFQGKIIAKETANTLPPYGLPNLSVDDFNRLATDNGIPMKWFNDKDNDGDIDPNEIEVKDKSNILNVYINNNNFTDSFKNTYKKLVELKRQETVSLELDQARPTIIKSDFSDFSSNEKKFVKKVVEAARIIEELAQMQYGSFIHKGKVPTDDIESLEFYVRNQNIWGKAPETKDSPFCCAVPTFPVNKSWNYPQELEHNPEMCEKLKSQPNAEDLFNPFTVVRKSKDGFIALPFTHHKAYGKKMSKISALLVEAASYLNLNDEKPFNDYLLAAARAFKNNDWEQADEAWSRMNSDNSKWYLRIAPDETYNDICHEKAGFHVLFALIDQGSKKLEKVLSPLRNDMEEKIADLLKDTPYKKRIVQPKMPAFITMILFAGDSRDALGATTGQSLPNWGKVRKEGRGRMVVRTNMEDDNEITINRAKLLFGPETMPSFNPDNSILLFNVVSHESVHQLGPQIVYEIDGKNSKEIFGGRLAYTLEETKAQTGVFWYIPFYREKGIFEDENALMEAYTSAIYMAYYIIGSSKHSSVYKNLSLIQLGMFLEDGAIRKVDYIDINGKKGWKFEVDFSILPQSAERVMKTICEIKTYGDKEAADNLIANYCTSEKGVELLETLKKRYRTFKEQSFTYELKFDGKDFLSFP